MIRRTAAWALVLGAALPFAVLLVVLLAQRPAITAYGDRAITTLEVRDLLGGHQLLGAYSRYRWHHPGPAYLVPLGVVYAAFGKPQWALDAGALVIAGTAAVVCVVAVDRTAGRAAAMATVGVIGLYVRCAGPPLFRDPWNAWVPLLPLLAVLVTAAAGAAGSAPALAGALFAAGFVVETHVGTAPVAVAVVTVAAASGWPAGTFSARAWLRPRTLAPAALAVAIWIPPLVQEVTGSDPNLTRLWHFAVDGHPGQSLATAISTVGDRLGQFPFGASGRMTTAHAATGWSGAAGASVVVACYLAASVALVAIGQRSGNRVARGLGAVTAVAIIAAVAGVTSIEGPLDGYLVAWITVIPLPIWIGAAALAARWRGGRVLAGAAAIAGVTVATVAAARTPSARDATAPGVDAAWAQLAPALRSRSPGAVVLAMPQPDAWPIAAGLAVLTEEHGWSAHVEPRWAFMFGGRRQETGTEAVIATVEPARVSVNVPPPPLSPPELRDLTTRVGTAFGP